jgi:hypothetical protein
VRQYVFCRLKGIVAQDGVFLNHCGIILVLSVVVLMVFEMFAVLFCKKTITTIPALYESITMSKTPSTETLK